MASLYNYNDQVSVASSNNTAQTVFPRSTSTNELYAYPEPLKKKQSVTRNTCHALPKSNSSPGLQLIPESKHQHHLTPYQIQRNTMRKSFQFPNGENFTPRNRLPKSSSAISLDRQRTTNHSTRHAPFPRSASMVSSVRLHQNSSQMEPPLVDKRTQLNNNSRTCDPRAPSCSGLNTNRKDFEKSTSLPPIKIRQLPNPSQISSSNRMVFESNGSQLSISSSINRPSTSSNDSCSTTVSMRDGSAPSSATSTDISVDESLKNTTAKYIKTYPISEKGKYCEQPKISTKKSSFSLGTFMKKLLPFNKKTKDPISQQLPTNHKFPSTSTNGKSTKAVTSNPGKSNTNKKSLEKPTSFFLESEEESAKEESINNLMDIDLVFDTILLKSERQQDSARTKLVEAFNTNIQGAKAVIEPPKRSSRRPQMIKTMNSKVINNEHELVYNSDDKILAHLLQNFKFVHLNSSLPPPLTPTNSDGNYTIIKKCRFNDEVYVGDTFSSSEYIRSDRRFLESRKQLMKTKYLEIIKSELNEFKKTEMQINPDSIKNTHFFLEII